jgi:acyl-CoA thioester hydrolase
MDKLKPNHVYEFEVLEMHLDTFQHVNNATYLTLFEQARWDWITRGGYGLNEIHKTQIGPTILKITIEYKRELKLHEKIKIETFLISFDGKIGNVRQQMVNAHGKVCTTIELTVGVFDLKQRKLVDAPKAWLKAIGA